MNRTNLDVCPVALAENENVVQFANVDGKAMIFAELPGDESVRNQLDKIYAHTDLSFETCRHPSVVESKCDVHELAEFDDEYDMMYLYT